MCGIGGILRVTPPGEAFVPIPEEWADALDESIRHRGPDGHGRFRDQATREDGSIVEVVLVHRRLSIIDHEDGAQPMVSERGPNGMGRVAVVFNGCLYNHRALREELEDRGHVFETNHSDTESMLHLYREKMRDPAYEMLPDGMYAAAVWDAARADCVLLQDTHREKPLHMHRGESMLLFSSALPGLRRAMRLADIPVDTSPDALADWIAMGFHLTAAPTRDISMAANDSLFGVTQSRVFSGQPRVDEAESILKGSVNKRLDADVPVGCFLSGGIDSSLIAKYAYEANPTIKTFCVRMPDERFDESQYAQQAADIIGCEHHTLDVSPEPARDLVHLITELGLPFGDSSILPTYWLCKAAREHVKVALSGDGGDELFVGYERQLAARWLRWARLLGPLAPLALSKLDRSDPKGRGDKAARFLEAARGCGYTDLVAIFPKRERERLLGGSLGTLCRKRVFGGINRAVWFDRGAYLPGDLLRKVDTASMAVGLEVRCPFLSRGMWEHFGQIPPKYLVPGCKRKAVLRELAYKHFPKALVDRPKQGFSIPVGEWFRTDFGGMRSLLHDKLDRERPFGAAHNVLDFNTEYVRTIIDEHMEQRRDHAQRLFMLTSLAVWSDTLEA